MRHILTALAALLCVGLLALAGGAPAATVFATPSTLYATLKAAGCGDTVILGGPQPFGATNALTGRACPPLTPLTVQGGSVAGAWAFSRASGLVFSGTAWTSTLRLDDSDHITVRSASFSGPNTVNALTLIRVKQASVTDSTFTGFKGGISAIDVSGVSILRNSFDRLRADGLVIGRGSHVLIDSNVCTASAVIWGADHPDCVQFYVNDLSVPTDITITRNRFSGMAQGVFLADGAYSAVRISDNVTQMGMARGISLSPCSGCEVSRNAVSTWPGAANQSGISVPAGVRRCSNTVARYVTPAGGVKKAVVDAAQCPSVAP